MTFLTYRDFGESTRAAIVKKLFDRYDELYVEWLVGTHGDCDLGQVIYSDRWVNRTWYEAETLSRVYCEELLFTWFDQITVHRWLHDRHGMSELPKRKTIHHPVVVSFQRARTSTLGFTIPCALPVIPVLEPIRRFKRHNVCDLEELSASEEFDLESVALPVEPVVRRSKRVKVQREFYYGY